MLNYEQFEQKYQFLAKNHCEIQEESIFYDLEKNKLVLVKEVSLNKIMEDETEIDLL